MDAVLPMNNEYGVKSVFDCVQGTILLKSTSRDRIERGGCLLFVLFSGPSQPANQAELSESNIGKAR